MRPNFDVALAPDGFAWWYLDAISDDGRHGLTVIAFIGSVFSPYYAWMRRKGPADPLDYCAVNIALYGPRGRWCMTERGIAGLRRDADSLRVGPSALRLDNDALVLDLDEWAVPVPRAVRGQVRVEPGITNQQAIALDVNGRHHWTPIWPTARIELNLECPALRWSGTGYLDHNLGTEPLERCFDNWSWSRAMTANGPVILYDTQALSGQRAAHTLHFDHQGQLNRLPALKPVALPHSLWRIPRPSRSDDGQASVLATWEDTPFYARSLISKRLLGEDVQAVHESLCLKRFASPWVQWMLPFRMPRRD